MSATVPVDPPKKRSKKPTAAEVQSSQLVDKAIQDGKRLAESRLDIIRLFLARGQTEIAQRRLKELLELHPETDEAQEARQLLKTCGSSKKRR